MRLRILVQVERKKKAWVIKEPFMPLKFCEGRTLCNLCIALGGGVWVRNEACGG